MTALNPGLKEPTAAPYAVKTSTKWSLVYKLEPVALGPVISSYAVDDRVQVADVDPSMHIEDFEEEGSEFAPCPICGDDDNEELLLSCDGCSQDFHTYCVGLDEIPRVHWFCDGCAAQRTLESATVSPRPHRPHNLPNRRTRGQRRRERAHAQASTSGWARVWQSVWDRLNIDLDFPFDDAPDSDTSARALSERRDFQEWERRFRIAERQGGANRFRDTASTLLDLNEHRDQRVARDRIVSPKPESQEEIRAWNALEKAKEIQHASNASRRKRKSATASPSDADVPERPERPLKRPRTRRHPELAEPSSDSAAEASHSNRRTGTSSSRTDVTARQEGPSFLQSLLKEVESSTTPDESNGQHRLSLLPVADYASPRYSSPGASPTGSNHASPRALSATPPPSISPRPGSPLSLTSCVEPIFPAPEFSPASSPTEPHRAAPEIQRQIGGWRESRSQHRASPESRPQPRADDVSPSRLGMSFTAKTDLQKMVATALKPHYHSQTVNKDQYTDINRTVSRLLYEKVGEDGNIDDKGRETWEKVAANEVTKAVESLKATRL
ncbi:MAG: hypothetical protein LQ351_005127 [Letrouitia transgressa]|nr:MAG: hypothetical protein LQ351_005127 [Letrouitia transgressa]